MTTSKPNISPFKPQVTKPELARWKAMEQLGLTPHAIGKRTGRDGKTVRKWLNSDVYQKDINLQNMVALIKEREMADLYLLGAKARKRLHELLDEGQTKVIETVALMDRSFQQRRILEDKSTSNSSHEIQLMQVHRSLKFDCVANGAVSNDGE